MPSVRNSLNGEGSKGHSSEQGQDLPENLADLSQPVVGKSEAELIAERLRAAADQRAALAQNEINRLQIHIGQLQERVQELVKMNLPPGGVQDDLDNATHRLEEAESDLARAQESRQNTDLAAGIGSHSHHEGLAPPAMDLGNDDKYQAPQSVRSALGMSGGAKKPPSHGPTRKL